MNKAKEVFIKFLHSVWLLPFLLLIFILTASVLKLSGSSIGIYHTYFYEDRDDPALVANEPQSIRSDEWIVSSQLTLAQSNNNYQVVNENIGYGQDMSFIAEAPYRDWTAIFRPQNFSFFLLPYDAAFAFRWWFIGVMLILSVYALTIFYTPKRKLFAALLAISVFFSPFVQWWYLYGTLASMYHAFFGILLSLLIIHATDLKRRIIWSILFFYNLVCFLLIIYPPFQIPALLVVGAFVLGAIIDASKQKKNNKISNGLLRIAFPSLFAALLLIVFYYDRSSIFNTLTNTAYPGERIVTSGGYDFFHFFSGQFAYLQQFTELSKHYLIGGMQTNASESSAFILLLPFIFSPLIYMLWKSKFHKTTIRSSTLSILFTTSIFLLWIFIPKLDFIGIITLLNKVPHNRLTIGFGLLSVLATIMLVKHIDNLKSTSISKRVILLYSFICFVFLVFVSLNISENSPLFLSTKKAIALSLPIPIIVGFILLKKPVLGALGLLAFSIFSTFNIHPIYKGNDVLDNHQLPVQIRRQSDTDPNSRWVTDESMLENFLVANGVKSLSGVYIYPQLEIWDDIEDDSTIYNRYAHTNYVFDRDPNREIASKLKLVGADNFGIFTEPCSDFIRENNVKYIVTRVEFSTNEKCVTKIDSISYPEKVFYIYNIVN